VNGYCGTQVSYLWQASRATHKKEEQISAGSMAGRYIYVSKCINVEY